MMLRSFDLKPLADAVLSTEHDEPILAALMDVWQKVAGIPDVDAAAYYAGEIAESRALAVVELPW